MDRAWWEKYQSDVMLRFAGERFSTNPVAVCTRVDVKGYGNSGAAAIAMAAQAGAKKIILLGYDCQKTDGKSHWHGDHPAGLGNASKINEWHIKFAKVAAHLSDRVILNASRETALACWPRVSLEEALC